MPVVLLLLAGCTVQGQAIVLDQEPVTTTDAQLPPLGHEALGAWLAAGHYQAWRCEAAPHPPRGPSAHVLNRICSNDLLAEHGDGPYPVDAANVKELFDAKGTLRGHAVYRRVRAGTNGDSWYWYEVYDGKVFADGLGDRGTAKSSCTTCHEGAGPATLGHDFVFTQVR